MKTKLLLLAFLALLGCSKSETIEPKRINLNHLDYEYSKVYSSSIEYAEQIHSLIKTKFGYNSKLVDIVPSQSASFRTNDGPPCFVLNNPSGQPREVVHMEMVDEGNGSWCFAYQWSDGTAHLSCWNSSGHTGYYCY